MRALLLPAALLVASCSSTSGPSVATSAPPNVPQRTSFERPLHETEPSRTPPLRVTDGALVESPSSRDPFRAFSDLPPGPPVDARPRKARRVPLDQLKLVGLVTNTQAPRAMLVDPSGKGYIVAPGDLVGLPEVEGDGSHQTAAHERTASFRVDRIREGDVVFVREGGDDDARPVTRVLSLPRTPLLQADD